MRYKITIEYTGTNFVGWQRQRNDLSIQEAIETALHKLYKKEIIIYGAGRTDAGVHAVGQVAHFDTDKVYNTKEIANALNHFLRPLEIGIINCESVDTNFHARFSAIHRHYFYRIINRSTPLILNRNRAWQVKEKLSLELMQEAANFLIGTHDFTSFRASVCQAKSPIKTISRIKLESIENEIKIWFSAPSFLHHMVRNITGTLVSVGTEKILPEMIKYILDQKERKIAGVTAPACGLYFYHIDY